MVKAQYDVPHLSMHNLQLIISQGASPTPYENDAIDRAALTELKEMIQQKTS